MKESQLDRLNYHVKNTLNTVSSILGLQMLEFGIDAKTKTILQQNKLRIEALAMIQDAISYGRNSKKINLQKYIKNLVRLINKSYDKDLVVDVDIKDIYLSNTDYERNWYYLK